MSRGALSKNVLMGIDQRLPQVAGARALTLSFCPDLFSMVFSPGCTVPVASVAFLDCTDTLSQIRFALFEYLAHGHYYRSRRRADEFTASYFERFFLDDAVLRLYAAAEQLTAAVMLMHEISDVEIAPFRQKRVSEQGVLAAFLRKHPQRTPLTNSLLAVGKSQEWNWCMKYRNRWVHEQPPTLSGRGLIYKRKVRWETTLNGKHWLGVGFGDQPEYDLATFGETTQAAFARFVGLVRSALAHYLTMLRHRGIRPRHRNRSS